MFAEWADPLVFASARIGPGGAVCWGDRIDMCPDALYLRLTGMSVEEYIPALCRSAAGA